MSTFSYLNTRLNISICNSGTYVVYYNRDPIESYELQMIFMLTAQNTYYVLPGTSVKLGVQGTLKTRWLYTSDKVTRFAAMLSGESL